MSRSTEETRSKGSMLVIRGGAIGDFILTLPVLAALRAHFSQTRLEVLGYGHIAQLAMLGGLAEAVRSIEARALAGFFARRGALSPALASYFRSFDVIVSYLYDPDGIFEENIKRCTEAQFIAGPHRPDETSAKHATEVFLEPLEKLAVFDTDPVPRLRVPGVSEVHSSAPRPIAMHPGSGSERKNWPEARWKLLVSRMVTETDAALLLVGGEAEGDRLERLAQDVPRDRVEVMRHRPLAEVGTRLAACRGFLGHDSGITHLAAALGMPCLVLWGDSREEVWRPRGHGIEVVRSADGLPGITVDRVFDLVQCWIRGSG